MAAASATPMYKLPDEMFLRIAEWIDTPNKYRTDIKTFCRLSKKCRDIGQEVLHRNATVRPLCPCGAHPEDNGVLFLLRTLLDRPDLAGKVRKLQFNTIRKNFADDYESKKELGFAGVRTKALARLQHLGYTSGTAWHLAVKNSIESALSGVLLTLVPNLAELDFGVRDYRRENASLDPMSALFGEYTAPPATLLATARNVHKLTVAGSQLCMLSPFTFNWSSLTTLTLKEVVTPTLFRLTGPGSLAGAPKLTHLQIEPMIQFGDSEYMKMYDSQLGHLFAALGCGSVTHLTMTFWLYAPHLHLDMNDHFDVKHLFKQFEFLAPQLEGLVIQFRNEEALPGAIDSLLDLLRNPMSSMKHFAALKHLDVPQRFLFHDYTDAFGDPGNFCPPNYLPRKLRSLALAHTDPDVIDWFKMEDLTGRSWYGNGPRTVFPKLETIMFPCEDEDDLDQFTEGYDQVWAVLGAFGITTSAELRGGGQTVNLTEYQDHDEDEEDDDDDDDLSDMPDLIDADQDTNMVDLLDFEGLLDLEVASMD
ncbi:hypothetical protein BDV95DRAFT_557874 [Massariosphaeria phaeospora]|uniref:F-box domain-containing protein n=1 Tax=Massariosphaeria phaeospora TaxID=100035 RepID=A0A7C8INM1_9PLEO|nr:hypothetical protein BDV95DRAFT_557874 [Massariosphaeria phaeospora]